MEVIDKSGGDLEMVGRLTKDLRRAAADLKDHEARYLVDLYYATQKIRIASSNRAFASQESEEPSVFVAHVKAQLEVIEQSHIKYALDKYVMGRDIGRRIREIHGLGPVLTAGLIAHINIEKAPYAGNIFAFAGLSPGVVWNKGEKRPWNASLKTLCWKIGDQFVKQSANPKCHYGAVYKREKAKIQAVNSSGGYRELAAATLATKKFRDSETKSKYEAGFIPDGRVDLMARRVAVKLFLSHMHYVWRTIHTGASPADPWVFSHGKHDPSQFIHPREFGWSEVDGDSRVVRK